MQSLTTPRLLLPAWDERFAGDLQRMSSDERVMRHMSHGVWSKEYAAQRHQEALDHWARHGFGWRAVLDRKDESFLGVAALTWLRTPVPGIEEPALEIGWWTEPHAWGRGIAGEAASAVLDDALHRVGAGLVIARCLPGNAASVRVMTKLGMTRHDQDAPGPYGDPIHIYTVRP